MKQDAIAGKIEIIDDDMVAVFSSKSPAERIAIVADANRTARILAAAGARYLHPNWDEPQIQAEVARHFPMEQLELLKFAAQALERLSIPYAVVGSYASSVWGEPRFTQDIDIVGILKISGKLVDRQSIDQSAEQLSVAEHWRAVLRKVKE